MAREAPGEWAFCSTPSMSITFSVGKSSRRIVPLTLTLTRRVPVAP